jgi:hypothetical protein
VRDINYPWKLINIAKMTNQGSLLLAVLLLCSGFQFAEAEEATPQSYFVADDDFTCARNFVCGPSICRAPCTAVPIPKPAVVDILSDNKILNALTETATGIGLVSAISVTTGIPSGVVYGGLALGKSFLGWFSADASTSPESPGQN